MLTAIGDRGEKRKFQVERIINRKGTGGENIRTGWLTIYRHERV